MILDALSLSENGRPVLLDGEVELSMMAKVGFKKTVLMEMLLIVLSYS